MQSSSECCNIRFLSLRTRNGNDSSRRYRRSLHPESQDLRKFLAAQNISLKPNELARIRELFGRNPTLVELHIFNIMWSEHCSYKSSRKVLKKYLPTESPDVVLGPARTPVSCGSARERDELLSRHGAREP